jgi:hypothetical protein
MDEAKIRELILDKQKDNKISCKAAFEIAEETQVSGKRIGELLNDMEIKICACQLGCFK